MTSVLPEGSLSVKERRQLLVQKGLAIANEPSIESTKQSQQPSSSSTKLRRSSSIHNNPPIPPSTAATITTTEVQETRSKNDSNSSNNSNLNNESFSSIKDRIKLLDKINPPTTSPITTINPPQEQPVFVPVMNNKTIPQPPPLNPSKLTTTSNNNKTNINSSSNITSTTTNQLPFIPPPPASLFSFDQIKELHRDEYEEFEYQLKQTELELERTTIIEENPIPSKQLPQPIHHNSFPSAPHHGDEEELEHPISFQQDGKNWNNNNLRGNLATSIVQRPIAVTGNQNSIIVGTSSTQSSGKSNNLPPTSRPNQQQNNMVIGNSMMKERTNISPPSSTVSSGSGSTTSTPNGTSIPSPMYNYPIKVQQTTTNQKSDEIQYPSAPSFDEIDRHFPEYQVVNNMQLQTMTNNIFQPITDSLSEVSEEDDYRMFAQFKEFYASQNVGMSEEKLYSLYISFRERYQQQQPNTQTNVNNKQPTVLLVNKSRVPTVGGATKAKSIVNPNSPTVSTTSSNSSGSNGQEKRRDGLRDVRKKYEEQKLEEMRIKQMKERNKAHYAQEMQQPCMDYNALVMRENSMYNNPVVPSNNPNVNNYPTINNPNDLISNGTYVPFKASHPQTNSHVTSKAINNSSGGGYSNYNYWPNNK